MFNIKNHLCALIYIFFITTIIGVSSCSTGFKPAMTITETISPVDELEFEDIPTNSTVKLDEFPLPAEPRQIEFTASDGVKLRGTYYPAEYASAPVIVLMHWARGDQTDWEEIAYWLQNRGLSGTSSRLGSETWLDPSWFPDLPEGSGYGIFTFTFRNCEGGCTDFNREDWLLDAQAAIETTSNLPGVDPDKLITIGASIGADGAVDACKQGCRGALSLSPGGYLTIPYDQGATKLVRSDPPRQAWCLAAEYDTPSAEACQSASGISYKSVIFPGNAHGLALINPDSQPNTLDLMLEFLQAVLGDN